MSAAEDLREILDHAKVNRTRQGTVLSKPEKDRLYSEINEKIIGPLEERLQDRRGNPKPKPMWHGFMSPEEVELKDLKKMDVVEQWATMVGVLDERKVLSVTLRDENDKAYAYFYTYVTSAGSHQMWLVHDDNLQELDLDLTQFQAEDGEASAEEEPDKVSTGK